ncbi:glycosyltransferase family 4 protein [bacterium]|nr:glycosyltransferase family 4 protein [bacterium]
MKKVIIITYYWPPSGGAGVQRWLKLSWYLQESGVQVYLIHPKAADASYFAFDKSLEKEIHPEIKLYPTMSFEPINFYKKLVGKEKVPTAGFSNVDPKSSTQKLSLFLRSNLFIPDPRKYWGNYAFDQAKKIIKEEGVHHVITTSPPHSAQLIGLKLKQKLGIKWIADLRDLWTDVYYYPLLRHSNYSRKIDAKYERKVLENADHVSTVSPGFVETYLEKSSNLSEEKFSFIPNGYDPRDFKNFNYSFKPKFVLTYTGTINLQYNFDPFITGLKEFVKSRPEADVIIRFVGFVDDQLKERIRASGLEPYFDYVGYVSHSEAINYLEKSFALLLFGPLNTQNKEGGIPAKVFEYLNAGRKVIYVGKKDGFVAKILSETGGGVSFETEEDELGKHLEALYSEFLNKQFNFQPSPGVEKYSREAQAEKFRTLLNRL